MTKDKNFSNQTVPSIIDTEYKDCNFSYSNCLTVLGQKVGHRIFPDDDTPRTFIDCNLTNCETPPGSLIVKANGQQIGMSVIGRNVIKSTDTVAIDGDTIIVNDYVDRNYGTYFQGVYTYRITPKDTPVEAI